MPPNPRGGRGSPPPQRPNRPSFILVYWDICLRRSSPHHHLENTQSHRQPPQDNTNLNLIFKKRQAGLSWGLVQVETVRLQRQIESGFLVIYLKLTEFHTSEILNPSMVIYKKFEIKIKIRFNLVPKYILPLKGHCQKSLSKNNIGPKTTLDPPKMIWNPKKQFGLKMFLVQ